MADQRWMDAVQEAHRRGVPVAQVLGELAQQEVWPRMQELMRLFGLDVELAAGYEVKVEALDFKAIGDAAERVLQAAAAADVLIAGAAEIGKEMLP